MKSGPESGGWMKTDKEKLKQKLGKAVAVLGKP